MGLNDKNMEDMAVKSVLPDGRPQRDGLFWRFNGWAASVATAFVDLFYIKPLRRFVPVDMFRYVFCGGLNLLISWVIYYIALNVIVDGHYLDLHFVVMSPHIQSLFIQFPFTFGIGFWFNKYVAFDYSPLRGKTQIKRYVGTVGVSLLIKYGLLKLFVETFGILPEISNALADIINAVCSYLMQKYFTFKARF